MARTLRKYMTEEDRLKLAALLTFVPAGEAAEALEALKACMRNTLNGVPIEAAADEPFLAWPDSS